MGVLGLLKKVLLDEDKYSNYIDKLALDYLELQMLGEVV